MELWRQAASSNSCLSFLFPFFFLSHLSSFTLFITHSLLSYVCPFTDWDSFALFFWPVSFSWSVSSCPILFASPLDVLLIRYQLAAKGLNLQWPLQHIASDSRWVKPPNEWGSQFMLALFSSHELFQGDWSNHLHKKFSSPSFCLAICLPINRFLCERHEQSKQDLKGLEETVVSHYLLSPIYPAPPGANDPLNNRSIL